MTSCIASPQAAIAEPMGFLEFTYFAELVSFAYSSNSQKKTKLSEKFELPDKRGFNHREKRERDS